MLSQVRPEVHLTEHGTWTALILHENSAVPCAGVAGSIAPSLTSISAGPEEVLGLGDALPIRDIQDTFRTSSFHLRHGLAHCLLKVLLSGNAHSHDEALDTLEER